MPCLGFRVPQKAQRNLRTSSYRRWSSPPSNGAPLQPPQFLLPINRRAALQDISTFHKFNALPWFTQLTHPEVLATQGPTTPSRCYETASGGPIWAVRRFVQGCPDCAMSKSPCHLPAGKLLPLPVPNRPWSHLGVDFVTGLPSSEGKTCILVIVDRFSKFCRLLPLKGLPTALEMAELLFNHVFWYYGIPEDIISDRGPQFISRYGRPFSNS